MKYNFCSQLNTNLFLFLGIVQDHLRITAIQIIVGIPITEMTIETIVGTIIVEAEILIEIPIAEITIMMGEIEAVDVAGEEVIVKISGKKN